MPIPTRSSLWKQSRACSRLIPIQKFYACPLNSQCVLSFTSTTTPSTATAATSISTVHSSLTIIPAVFSSVAKRASALSAAIRARVTSTDNSATKALCSCNWRPMPAYASVTWPSGPRTSSASAANAASCAFSLALRGFKYLSAAGISRAKWGNRSSRILGHMPLVYVLCKHSDHRGRPPPPAQHQGRNTGQQDCRDEALGPKAVDAPLVNDVGLNVAEKSSAEKADAGQLEHNPQPSP